MSVNTERNDDSEQHDGYNVVETFDNPAQWANAEVEGHSEYVHAVFGDGELRLYRTRNEGYPNERIKTTIENVRFRSSFDGDRNGREVKRFFLSWMQAENMLSFAELCNMTRDSSSRVKATWYENNRKPAHEGCKVKHETLSLTFENVHGTRRSVQISDTWSSPSNKMATTVKDD